MTTTNKKSSVYIATTKPLILVKYSPVYYLYSMWKLLCTCFLILWNFLLLSQAKAQSQVIDSLETFIENPATSNGKRIRAMDHLSKILSMNSQQEESMKLADQALKLSYSEEDKGYPAIVHSTLSYLHAQQDSLVLAFQAMDSAQWYAAQTKDRMFKGKVLSQKGWLESRLGNRDKAYQYMLEALRLFEGEEAYLQESQIYHRLAAIYAYWEEPEKQLYYTRLCRDAALKSKDPDAITNAYLTMGVSCIHRFRKDSSLEELLDSSKFYNKLVLEITTAIQERITVPTTKGIAALNIANLYFEFHPPIYKDSAEKYLNLALGVGKETGNIDIVASSYGIMSEYALMEGDYSGAESLLQRAQSELINSSESYTLLKSRISNALARVAEQSGNPDKALDYYKQYMQFDKQWFDEEKLSITQQLEAQYQSEKKELELTTARQEAAFIKKLNRYYLILIITAMLALFFLFRSYHFRIKSSQQRQLLLTGEKNEAELQARLKAEETTRLQIEHELMHERMDRLEKELLAGSLQVEEKNSLMKDLREKLGSLDSSSPMHRHISRLISKNHEVDKGYNDLKHEFVDIRPEFVTGLQLKAENKLTRLDLKYCSYILMGLTNKDIASRLNVDPKSIRMARYRIKQKLKLDKNESLDQFIVDLDRE